MGLHDMKMECCPFQCLWWNKSSNKSRKSTNEVSPFMLPGDPYRDISDGLELPQNW